MEPVAADADRSRAAVALLARNERLFLGIARRVSICADDADDAYQRAVEILLTKAPAVESPRLVAWMAVVTRREAMAVRRARERLLGATPTAADDDSPQAWLERIACDRSGPAEELERRERTAAAARALAQLKVNERVALALQAGGYSYAEICDACDWTYTKVNRCLAEGRARLRELEARADRL
ncbi:MAG TPA: sigma-70 family RNA polymerase sigma factor [Solirubrobacterales bacterium]|jgi:RNA polymerase sigma factor (sigma-70 family)|nr:sigma-70 family RNA polymerase sigma factor [Solirubrobacterales bacterium]